MERLQLRVWVGVLCLACVASVSMADAISVNIEGNLGISVGGQTAGVVSVGNWNEYAGGAGNTLSGLVDDQGVATTAAYTMTASNPWSTVENPAIPGDPGSNAMMNGHNYLFPGETLNLWVAGVPYTKYDIYVYYNSQSVVNNSQTFTLLEKSASLLANENTLPGVVTAFVECTGANNGNYIVFRDVDLSVFTLQSTTTPGAQMGYLYVNGIQIVEVPEPATMVLLGAGGLLTLLRRRK